MDADSWQQVQDQLASNSGKEIGGKRKSAKRILDGHLFDEHGRAMGTTYASKGHARTGSRQSKRYWYYAFKKGEADDTIKVQRLPVGELEGTVSSAVQAKLTDRAWLADQLKEQDVATSLIAMVLTATLGLHSGSRGAGDNENPEEITSLIQRIDLVPNALRITLDLGPLTQPVDADGMIILRIDVPFTLHQKGRAKPIIITPDEVPIH